MSIHHQHMSCSLADAIRNKMVLRNEALNLLEMRHQGKKKDPAYWYERGRLQHELRKSLAEMNRHFEMCPDCARLMKYQPPRAA
jgi:hypothetical protein